MVIEMKTTRDAMDLARRAADTARERFGENLLGAYLHGSLALGGFTWEKSDVDLLFVTARVPAMPERAAFLRAVLALDDEAPPKGIELSAVTRAAAREPAFPPPYFLHYSPAHREKYRADLFGTLETLCGADPDLSAHFAVTRARGVALYGPPPAEMFGEVSRADYLRSVWSDIQNAEAEILRDPAYVILNLCRTAAYLEDGAIRSKAEGGAWASAHLPAWGQLLSAARAAYRNEAPFPAGRFDLPAFAGEMLRKIRSAPDFPA